LVWTEAATDLRTSPDDPDPAPLHGEAARASAAMRRIAEVARLCREHGDQVADCLAVILNAAIELTRADKGNIQLLDSEGALVIAAHQGFDAEFLAFFERQPAGDGSACAMALATGEQVIVDNVETSSIFSADALQVMLRAGERAVQSTPLKSSTGSTLGMISTHFSEPYRPTEDELTALLLLGGVAADYLEHAQTRKRARWSAEALDTLLEILPVAAAIATDPECREVTGNQAAAELYGASRPEELPRNPANRGDGELTAHYLDGRKLRTDELPIQRAAATGLPQRDVILDFILPSGEARTISASAAPLFDDDGTVAGAVGAFADITSLRRAQQVQTALARELLHRGNNLLAVVQTLAHRSFSGGVSVDEGLAKLEARLQALARANSMLVKADFEGVSIRELVRAAMEPFAPQTRMSGEDIFISPADVQNLTMAIHELATNALKHGALSSDDGVVNVGWRQADERPSHIRFVWREGGGPPVSAPTRYGLGTRLIQKLYKDVEFQFAPDGLRCEISVPLREDQAQP
jgi:two-component sensor histidine kinase